MKLRKFILRSKDLKDAKTEPCGGPACQAEGALCRDLEGRESAHGNLMEEVLMWLGFEK